MQNRQRKTKDPCPVCYMHRERCLCADIPRLETKTKLSLVVHYRELRRTTNTGRLAVQALVNSEMRVRGEGREALDLSDLLVPEYRTLLFYPSEGALPLTRELVEADPRPIQLIVPDGNWRQASKVHYRHHELRDVQRVMITEPNLSTQHLRAESTEFGMATLQAIAKAFAVIEGEEVGAKLMALYDLKLQRTLEGRVF